MSHEQDSFDVQRLVDLATKIDDYVLKFKEAIVDQDSDSEITELADDLWEVLDEIEDVLQTIEFEEIPEAIDVDELPEAIDVQDIPEGLFDEDENAIELTSVKEAVNLRELWDAVDLTELYQQKQELEDEVDEAADHMGDGDEEDDGLLGTDIMDDNDQDDELFEDVVDIGDGAHVEFNAEARQAVIEEKIRDAVVKFREMLLTTHDKLEKLYRMNQEKLGQPGRQPNSLNPTAASTMPSGPVPETASLRTSTVPSQVRYSRIENPRRIYAHRFHEATEDEEESKESRDSEEETADEGETGEEQGERDEADEEDVSSAEGEDSAEDTDEEIVLEVHDE